MHQRVTNQGLRSFFLGEFSRSEAIGNLPLLTRRVYLQVIVGSSGHRLQEALHMPTSSAWLQPSHRFVAVLHFEAFRGRPSQGRLRSRAYGLDGPSLSRGLISQPWLHPVFDHLPIVTCELD